MPGTKLPKKFLRLLEPALPTMLKTLRKFVTCESPSMDKHSADRCCGVIAEAWRQDSVRVHRVTQKHRGDHLRITWDPGVWRSKGQLFVLGHYDTVYSAGTLRKMPFRVAGGKAFGPGTFDMKAGIVQALFALQALQHSRLAIQKRLVFFWSSDEEIGSQSSRKLIESEARRSDAVFVLEPSYGPNGLLKTSRKGVGEVEFIVHGRASHAGLAPEAGVNAIHELGAQISRIEKWNDLHRGITINADTIEGGTRVNVIAESARAMLDLRASTLGDMRSLERRLHALRPIHTGARLEIKGGFTRPPLERTVSAALFAHAKSLAFQMNLALGECSVGGGSDGNFTGALGIPTLDGLGAVGDGAHSTHEHILVNAMPSRAALLAALLATS
jgi:glutamate carboxypeptidase